MISAAVAHDGADMLALGSAMTARGMDSELAARAMYAYRRSQGLVPVGLN